MNLERTIKQWECVVPSAIASSSPAAVTYFAADAQKDIAALAKELAVQKGKNASMLRLLAKIRDGLGPITTEIEDEGDRAYFGSTNDADRLRDFEEACMSWIVDAEVPHLTMTSDPYADIREQRDRAEKAEAALAAKNAEIAKLREALEFIADVDARPYRCGNIARAALEEQADA